MTRTNLHAFFPTSLLSATLVGAMLLGGAATMHAQQGPAPGNSGAPGSPQGHDHRGGGGPEGHGMGIVPPGTWWRSPDVIAALTLTPDQQKRLDDIFQNSRVQLIQMHANLEQEQVRLEPLLNANPPDQGSALAEISKIADMRAELEKTDARMLLSLRGVLSADQWTKLRAMHHDHDGKRGPGGPGGPGGQRGPHGPGGPGGSNAPQPPAEE